MMDYTILRHDSLKEKYGDKKSYYFPESKRGRVQETHKVSDGISAKIKKSSIYVYL